MNILRRPSTHNRRAVFCPIVVVVALCVGCGSGPQTGSTDPASSPEELSELAAMVPSDIREEGRITIGLIDNFKPFSFVDEDGELAGFEPALMLEVGERLDLEVELAPQQFDALIPGIQSARFDAAVADIAIRPERLEAVDFVTYYVGENAFLAAAGSDLPIAGLDSLCGYSVSVLNGSSYIAQVEEANAQCTDDGSEPIDLGTFADRAAVTLAVTSGQYDVTITTALAAEERVVASEGQLEAVGERFKDGSLIGIALPKASEFADPLAAALNEMIDDGTYDDILSEWGAETGAIGEAEVMRDR